MKNLLTSKKFWVSIITTCLVAITVLTGMEINIEQIIAMISPMLAYIIGQGIADHGKESVKEIGKEVPYANDDNME